MTYLTVINKARLIGIYFPNIWTVSFEYDRLPEEAYNQAYMNDTDRKCIDSSSDSHGECLHMNAWQI